jgi:hypothetical protein
MQKFPFNGKITVIVISTTKKNVTVKTCASSHLNLLSAMLYDSMKMQCLYPKPYPNPYFYLDSDTAKSFGLFWILSDSDTDSDPQHCIKEFLMEDRQSDVSPVQSQCHSDPDPSIPSRTGAMSYRYYGYRYRIKPVLRILDPVLSLSQGFFPDPGSKT